jgi:hypothetical protein
VRPHGLSRDRSLLPMTLEVFFQRFLDDVRLSLIGFHRVTFDILLELSGYSEARFDDCFIFRQGLFQ